MLRRLLGSMTAAVVAVKMLSPGAVASAGIPAPSLLRQEWVGLEAAPLSLNVGSSPAGESPSRLQFTPGGTLRLLRHRWRRAYVTPAQMGVFVGPVGQNLIFMHVGAEAGLIIISPPKMRGALEMGMGIGAGILSIPYSPGCDGSCNIGGGGLLLTPVVRYVPWANNHFAVGIAFRAVVPTRVPDGNWFGYYTARGILFLACADVAFGY